MAISNQYENETKEAIHQRMLERVSDDIDKRQGSVTHDMTAPASIELELAYTELSKVYKQGFADTATGTNLERRAAELGLSKKPAVKAIGNVTFGGNDGVTIPEGTIVETDDGRQFVTDNEGVITNGSITVGATAVNAGTDGNVSIGEIEIVVGDLQGIVTVTNEASFNGGVDEESDDELRERYFERVQNPVLSGNPSHYRQWALEVPGIGDVKVYPTANGPGTVKLVVVTPEGRAPDEVVLDNLDEHIEENRPINADVSVEPAIEDAINVTATLTITSGNTLDDVRDEVEANLRDYITSLPFGNTEVRYAQIGFALLESDKVIDYQNLTVNGGTANITVNDDHVAVLGSVTIN